ncbi:M1 family aminopeptidase [Microbulbifer thermotolerans]|uniref:M1 family metallopeptidase n=1 Tax=Microbulbifer thermotolerans TaxID=252514 RepID=UPI00224A4E11|nr:M1 family metallopeptidase [Microbulbifer thermotolerans]MCX2782141.1 M1 family aminopeptidase [Microbulbifer thermotolerans]MCX2836078.1 M1 family aminopeptidase [Microbulbifer thermotolerans]
MNKIILRSLLAIPLLALVACGPSEKVDGNKTDQKPAAEAAAGLGEAPTGKLPEGVRPTAYRLDLLLDPRRDGFTGQVEIDIHMANAADHIWLHGKNIRVSEATALLPGGKQIPAQYQEMLDSGVAAVRFGEDIPAGTFTLRMNYSADYDRNLAGLFKVEEQGDAYVLAKSESIQARKYLPGFDEPGLKAPFDIRLTVPEGYAAISNGAELKREPAGQGLEKVTFATTRPMSTYLLSLSVGPFDVVERPAIPANQYRDKPIPLRGFARKGRGGDMKYILDVTPRLVEIFETELERPYPFEKLDIVAAPQWPSGATELSAAITYREQRILVGDTPAPGARLSLLGVHAHEIAHMWFGNLVTPPWWDDLWLKEGFATWGTPLALTIFEPNGGHDLNAAVRAISAMQLDSLASTRAIREPIADNNNVRNAYDAITYAKSLGVIHMVDNYFGADKFRPALGRYIESHADGVADAPDFYRVIGEETDSPALTETFRTFVEQKGVPLLDIALDCNKPGAAKLQIAQRRYRPLGSPIADTDQRWNIPFCFSSDTETQQCLMLTKTEQQVDIPDGSCPQWVMPNAEGSGYYRWTLAPAQWQALAEHFTDFSPSEQLSIIDSAFAAFEAGQLPQAQLLAVVRQSAHADQRQVIVAPLRYLQKYRGSYLGEEQKSAFLNFTQNLYLPILERTAGSADSEEQLLHSALLSFMALTAGDGDARKTLADKAIAFTGYKRKRDAEALDSDLYEAALTVAVQDTDGFLDHLIAMRAQLDDPRFESASANAIGRNRNPKQLDKIQQLALSGDMGAREAFGLIQQALSEPAVREANWQWLQQHFTEVVNKVPAQWRRQTPAFARAFCDKGKLTEVRQLFAQHGQLAPGHQRSLAQTEEQIQLCMALKEKGEALFEALPLAAN